MALLLVLFITQGVAAFAGWVVYEETGSLVAAILVPFVSVPLARWFAVAQWLRLGDRSELVDGPGWFGSGRAALGRHRDESSSDGPGAIAALIAWLVYFSIIDAASIEVMAEGTSGPRATALLISAIAAAPIAGVANSVALAFRLRRLDRRHEARLARKETGMASSVSPLAAELVLPLRRGRALATWAVLPIVFCAGGVLAWIAWVDAPLIVDALAASFPVILAFTSVIRGVVVLRAPHFARLNHEGLDLLGKGLIPWHAIEGIELTRGSTGVREFVIQTGFRDLTRLAHVRDDTEADAVAGRLRKQLATEDEGGDWMTPALRRAHQRWPKGVISVETYPTDRTPDEVLGLMELGWGLPTELAR